MGGDHAVRAVDHGGLLIYELYCYYERGDLPAHEGSFVVVGQRGTVLVPRGQVGFPDRATCSWPSCSAGVASTRMPIDLFLERNSTYQYLGEATLAAYGRPQWDAPPEATFNLISPLPRERWLELQEPLPQRTEASERAIAALTDRSTTAERASALEMFVERWFGSRPDTGATQVMPSPLTALHRLARANPKIISQNALVLPGSFNSADGRSVFYIENQHVCDWAFGSDGDDPTVWYRAGRRARWQREHEPLSGFVIQVVLFEAIMGHASGFGASAACLSPAATERLRERFQPLPLGPWLWGPSSFHAHDGALLWLMANREGFTAVLAALHPEALTFVADLVDARWDLVAF